MRTVVALLALVGCSAPQTTLSNNGTEDEGLIGDGVISVDKTEIVIADIEGTYSKSESFTITSAGDGNLLVYEIRLTANPDEVFFFDEVEDVELATGQTATYTVVAHYREEPGFPTTGELRIRSNDADAPTLLIPLAAYPEGYEPPEDTGGDTGGDTGSDTGAR